MSWLWWAILSAVFAALTAILAKVGVRGIESNLAAAIRTVVVLVFAWIVAASSGPINLWAIERRSWFCLVLSGLATGASWLCYFRALQLGDASRVAPIDKLSVIMTVLLAWSLLGESVGWRQWVGATLMAVGALLIARR